MCHTVEDSYSCSHTVRQDDDTQSLLFFQSYNFQDGKKHGEPYDEDYGDLFAGNHKGAKRASQHCGNIFAIAAREVERYATGKYTKGTAMAGSFLNGNAEVKAYLSTYVYNFKTEAHAAFPALGCNLPRQGRAGIPDNVKCPLSFSFLDSKTNVKSADPYVHAANVCPDQPFALTSEFMGTYTFFTQPKAATAKTPKTPTFAGALPSASGPTNSPTKAGKTQKAGQRVTTTGGGIKNAP